MNAPLTTAAAVICLGLVYVLFPRIVHTLQYYRKKQTLQCPENGQTVELDVDAGQAALSSAFGRPRLKIEGCTRWPARKDCGQGCAKSL